MELRIFVNERSEINISDDFSTGPNAFAAGGVTDA